MKASVSAAKQTAIPAGTQASANQATTEHAVVGCKRLGGVESVRRRPLIICSSLTKATSGSDQTRPTIPSPVDGPVPMELDSVQEGGERQVPEGESIHFGGFAAYQPHCVMEKTQLLLLL